MEKELDSEVIKATQNSLGKFVKRPALTDKLLKKPPFRFLHDIVTTVLKTTGFFEGLFEEHELVSDNVKDRESKIAFLNKVIVVVGTTIGKPLSVKSTKIVAGQEPEKTNELLQHLALALDKRLSSDEAVRLFKNGEKQPVDTKTKDAAKPAKKVNEKQKESLKLTSRSSEKLTTNIRNTKEQSLTRNDKDKVNAAKTKQKENIVVKKETPPKKSSQQNKTVLKKNSVDKPLQNNYANVTPENKNPVPNENENVQSVTNKDEKGGNYQDSGVSLEKHDISNGAVTAPRNILNTEQGNLSKLEGSITIAENDLNSSLSSQDLMEVEFEENRTHNKHNNKFDSEVKHSDYEPNKLKVFSHTSNTLTTEESARSSRSGTNSEPQSLTKDTDKSSIQISATQVSKIERVESSAPVTRPKSVRPSSSRPGAPRLREKHENVLATNDNLLLGKVNIIVENTPNEEEEDASIIIIDQPTETSTTSKDQQEHLISSNQHGHLVQQILDSQKEFSQIAGKTEIEWQFGAQKAREAANQEVEQLRFNIQALSRVANPLGKLLDHMQEDVEVMRQEMQQWTKTYEDASKELQKQKTANEDSLYPLHTKLKQLDLDIDEKRDKINDLKIVIHKNSSRIERLLAGGDVQ